MMLNMNASPPGSFLLCSAFIRMLAEHLLEYNVTDRVIFINKDLMAICHHISLPQETFKNICVHIPIKQTAQGFCAYGKYLIAS